jgi:hypothetical protein
MGGAKKKEDAADNGRGKKKEDAAVLLKFCAKLSPTKLYVWSINNDLDI